MKEDVCDDFYDTGTKMKLRKEKKVPPVRGGKLTILSGKIWSYYITRGNSVIQYEVFESHVYSSVT